MEEKQNIEIRGNIGILDPEGKNLNPLNNKPYSHEYRELAKIWREFPAYEKRMEIITAIQHEQVILIISGTGSGKTVLVPKFVLHSLGYDKKIAITLPKQIIAKSSAEFSAKTLDVNIGEQVGYQYKGSPKSAVSNDVRLLYATDGTIRARLMKDPLLKDFDAVIIDEAHERKIQIDFLLYLLRETIKMRPEFKLIIMSATVDPTIFREYFYVSRFKKIDIGGKTNYPIESIFLDESLEYKKILDKGVDIIENISNIKIDKTKESNGIIFFVTSSNEAIDTCKKINERIINKGIFCIEVFSGMNPDKQNIAQEKDEYKKYGDYDRKIVISTNVAESSLTIEGIRYVIDSGYELFSKYDPDLRAKVLDRQMISQAQAKQRMGRTGRTEPGICYHLYARYDYEHKMKKYPEADILVSDITNDCLELLANDNIRTLPNLLQILTQFIEPPKELYIDTAVMTLMQLGFIVDNEISDLGYLAVQIGYNSPISNLFAIYGLALNCHKEINRIISMMEVCKNNLSEIYTLPSKIIKDDSASTLRKKLEEKFTKTREKFRHKSGDHLSILNIYDKFYKTYKKNKDNYEKIRDWAYTNFLKIDTLLKAKQYSSKNKSQLSKVIQNIDTKILFKRLNLDENLLKKPLDERILTALSMSHNINRAYKNNKDFYSTKYSEDLKINIDRNSFLQLKTLPKEVIYEELFINMGRPELNIVSKI